MISVLSVENMRKSDARTIENGVPGRELMYRAGRGVFEAVRWKPPVAVVCGSGNNAGDGYVVAKLLHDAGIPCEVIRLSEKCSEDGGYYLGQCLEAGVPVKTWEGSLFPLRGCGTVVDCLFGTGFRGPVRGAAKEIIDSVRDQGFNAIRIPVTWSQHIDSKGNVLRSQLR